MATQKETSPQSGGLQKFVFASIGVSLIGLLFGFFIAAILIPVNLVASDSKVDTSVVKPAEVGAPETEETSGAADKVEGTSPENYDVVRIEPIITNLSDSTEVWVRLEGSMLFGKEMVEERDLLVAKISQHVLAYLKTLKLSDLQGNGAVNAISQDLDEIATTVSEGQSQGVLISGLVFE
jgi:flagellar protein FliL